MGGFLNHPELQEARHFERIDYLSAVQVLDQAL
jgi:hypothetical protein